MSVETNITNTGDEHSATSVGGSSSAKNFSRTPTSWDAQDDILLMHLKDQQKLGWKEIASHFTNRTPNACQFRWRRLKSGNLKNPPRSGSASGSPAPGKGDNAGGSGGSGGFKRGRKAGNHEAKSESPLRDGLGGFSTYSPITTASFTGYNNNVNNALAGLNALSNTPSSISSPINHGNTANSSVTGLNSPTGTQSQIVSHFDSPNNDSLDPQSHQSSSSNSGGGYYADISVDPTMNLPHNQPHPPHGTLMSRGSASHSHSAHQTTQNIHSNSIIQTAKDDRTSVSSTRASISSLPSKSMNIPHHQLNNSALAHLPIPFGGGGSISGPSIHTSISGPTGLPSHQTSANISSLRNGSVFGGLGYYSRSGSVVIPFNGEKKDDENKLESKKPEKTGRKKGKNKSSLDGDKDTGSTKNDSLQPLFKIPWSMEEDELLINRRNRELSFAELSILLPQRTEGEIWSRIDYLEKLRNGHRSSTSRPSGLDRRSSVGLDDVDDLYSEGDIGGIDVSDDDDADDDVLVDVDESIHSSRKTKKRRTSSAVNPLAVGASIRKKYR